MLRRNKIKFLFVIFTIGAFIRIYKLGDIPPGLYLDEVLYGLDSLSILKTGRDTYGHLLPLAFQSSGYYPPLYPYLLTPFIALFNLADWVIRAPAAIAGVGVIIITYKFSKYVVGKDNILVPLISGLLIAVSPWHTHISRVSFLAGFGLFFLLTGTYLFIRGQKRGVLSYLSAIFFALSMFAHYGYIFLSPAIYIFLLLIFGKKLNLRRNH